MTDYYLSMRAVLRSEYIAETIIYINKKKFSRNRFLAFASATLAVGQVISASC